MYVSNPERKPSHRLPVPRVTSATARFGPEAHAPFHERTPMMSTAHAPKLIQRDAERDSPSRIRGHSPPRAGPDHAFQSMMTRGNGATLSLASSAARNHAPARRG